MASWHWVHLHCCIADTPWSVFRMFSYFQIEILHPWNQELSIFLPLLVPYLSFTILLCGSTLCWFLKILHRSRIIYDFSFYGWLISFNAVSSKVIHVGNMPDCPSLLRLNDVTLFMYDGSFVHQWVSGHWVVPLLSFYSTDFKILTFLYLLCPYGRYETKSWNDPLLYWCLPCHWKLLFWWPGLSMTVA